jgi:hypothetical protein
MLDDDRADTSSIAAAGPSKDLHEIRDTQLSVTEEMGVTNKDVGRRQIHAHGERGGRHQAATLAVSEGVANPRPLTCGMACVVRQDAMPKRFGEPSSEGISHGARIDKH